MKQRYRLSVRVRTAWVGRRRQQRPLRPNHSDQQSKRMGWEQRGVRGQRWFAAEPLQEAAAVKLHFHPSIDWSIGGDREAGNKRQFVKWNLWDSFFTFNFKLIEIRSYESVSLRGQRSRGQTPTNALQQLWAGSGVDQEANVQVICSRTLSELHLLALFYWNTTVHRSSLKSNLVTLLWRQHQGLIHEGALWCWAHLPKLLIGGESWRLM